VYIVPQTATAATLYVTNRARLHPRTLTYDQTAIRSPGLPFNGLRPCNPYNYMDYYSFTDPEGMEGWVGWPIGVTCQP